MHSSGSANNKPRQRTFTSCTECRRRKQKCNQAKDKPCNNCARRYPPVLCTYESSSPPALPEHGIDIHDQGQIRYDHQSSPLSHPMGAHTHSQVINPAYAQPPNTPYNTAFVFTSNSDSYFPLSYSSFNTPTSRPYYQQPIDPTTTSVGHSTSPYIPTTNSGPEYLADDGDNYYGATDPAYVGYYGDVSQVSQNSWITGQGNMTGFAGANTSGQGDYFYSGEQNHVIRTTRG